MPLPASHPRLRYLLLSLLLIILVPSAHALTRAQRHADRWAQKNLRRMTLQQEIGQMILVWAHMQFTNPASPDFQRLLAQMRTYHIGSFGLTIPTAYGHLVKAQPLEVAALTNQLQRDSSLPLLFAADFERGLSMRIDSATAFPSAMAFGATGDPALARQFGRISAVESRALGIHWNWFPVADINSNPANPIINTRSFGADPALVSRMVTGYIDGAHSAGLLVTAKHFPGHGDTDTDSHLTLARITATRAQLDSLELVPFRAAIAAHVDAIMIGHLIVPALDPDPNRPASISHRIATDLLQHQLGFHGLVVTDALDMAGLMQVFSGTPAEESAAEAVAAVLAGNDMVIIPADLPGAYNGLLNAVQSGQITRQRIDRSVLKILRLKASLGLDRHRLVPLDRVTTLIAQPDHLAFAQSVAQRAITLVRDQTHQLPLSPAESPTVALVLTDDAHHTLGGQAFLHALRARSPAAQSFLVDADNVAALTPHILAAVHAASRVLVLAESFPSAGRTVAGQSTGSAGLDPQSMQLLSRVLTDAGPRTVLVAFGNPYIGSAFAHTNSAQENSAQASATDDLVSTYLCTFSNTPESALAAVRALFGETPITGHLPVALPSLAPHGTGIQLAARNPSPAR